MEELRKINTTLVLLLRNNKILLGEKKRGFAKGTLNGIGGKQDPGESIEQAMIRETQEEIGVTPISYKLIGKIKFNLWYKGEYVDMFLSIYTCDKFSGEIAETEEMIPAWYDVDNIPFDRMLKDDLLWLPMALEGKKFIGKVNFDPNMEMLSHEFKEVKNLENEKNI